MTLFIRLILLLTMVFTVATTWPVRAQEARFCLESLGDLPIQQNGRIKPLYVHAGEVLKFLTGKRKVPGYGRVQAYCYLSSEGLGLPAPFAIKMPIEHVDTRALLGVEEITYRDLADEMMAIRQAYGSSKTSANHQKFLGKILQKWQLYQEVTSGNNWLLPQFAKDTTAWIPLTNWLTKEKMESLATQGNDPFALAFDQVRQLGPTQIKAPYLFEFKYAKMHLAGVSMLITLLGLIAFISFKNHFIGLGLAGISFLIQLVLITCRVYISGRGPVTNMYETVLFSGFGALGLALVLGHFKKEKIFLLVGLAYSFCTLMMLNFAGGMLDSSISPLVPVLRDNFWLSTHVTTIILSYGALALSWVLANILLFRMKLKRVNDADIRYYSDIMYTCLKYGTVLLIAGIILGGIWADYSWGRFWGWDPKETWSLIVFCLYVAILHGKSTSWITPKRFISLTAFAFLSVLMAWFGVNYILASGLHSYGFSEGGAIFLGVIAAVQLGFLAITWPREA